MIVGLTGGIGSGKSTVANVFKELGIPVYDSDLEAKNLMVTNTLLIEKIKSLFGEEAYVNGNLNRDYIASKVFLDKKLLNKLNTIVHPAVRKHFFEWTEEQEAPYVIQEAAIIFENKMQSNYDAIVLVVAPIKTRVQRVVSRDGSSEEEVLVRINNQLPDEDKIPESDFVIENIDLESTKKRVVDIHDKLLKIVV